MSPRGVPDIEVSPRGVPDIEVSPRVRGPGQ